MQAAVMSTDRRRRPGTIAAMRSGGHGVVGRLALRPAAKRAARGGVVFVRGCHQIGRRANVIDAISDAFFGVAKQFY